MAQVRWQRAPTQAPASSNPESAPFTRSRKGRAMPSMGSPGLPLPIGDLPVHGCDLLRERHDERLFRD